MFDPSSWDFTTSAAIFVACAAAIAYLGTRLTALADQLADRSGIGEALIGGALMGAATSMSGSVLSITAAWNGNPDLALSNAIGGMAAQLAFLAVADLCYRKANLEHAAASSENIMQGALLICLLSVLLVSTYLPESWRIGHVHIGTIALLGAYLYGMRLVHRNRQSPMWRPENTAETELDEVDPPNLKLSLPRLWIEFLLFAAALGICGWTLQYAAWRITEETGLSQALMGALFTAVATSLPELVTSIAAVRRGALTLAVSGIIGGNAYDSLFAAFSDIAYLPSSIYHTASKPFIFWISINCLMTGVLLMGLVLRERRGVGGIGFESVLLLAFYVGAIFVAFSF